MHIYIMKPSPDGRLSCPKFLLPSSSTAIEMLGEGKDLQKDTPSSAQTASTLRKDSRQGRTRARCGARLEMADTQLLDMEKQKRFPKHGGRVWELCSAIGIQDHS